MIGRRKFVTLVGGAAAWPLSAQAQQAAKILTIGYLGPTTLAVESQRVAAFVQRLRELGWSEGRNLAIEYRWAEGRSERFSEIAAEFVRLKVDVIVTYATPPVIAAKQATSLIPIVFAVAGDPVNTGLVASLAHPGGNVTGLSVQQTELAGKRLELLREVVRDLRRLAIMGNANNPATVPGRMADTIDCRNLPPISSVDRWRSSRPADRLPRTPQNPQLRSFRSSSRPATIRCKLA
jgi:putative ABC transport system substrate-binding protein